MKSILLSTAVILAVLATIVQKGEGAVSSKLQRKILGRDAEGSPYEKKTLDLGEKIAKLEEVLEKVEEGFGKLCKSGFTSPWCGYKQSLFVRKESGFIADTGKNTEENTEEITEENAGKNTGVNTEELPDMVRREMGRCRTGVAHCPNGKREFVERRRRARHCPGGWPWCQTG